MAPLAGDTCNTCGERLPAMPHPGGLEMCSACQEARPLFSRATAYGAYESELRELIHLLKYEGVLPAAAVLGRMLAEAIEKLDIGQRPVALVPVPLYCAKKRQRGFNQAQSIARAAMKASRKPTLHLLTDVLVRERDTVSQIGLTRPQRVENIRGAFRVLHPTRVAGQRLLLVDDVLTSGTTASECARVLRKAGAASVFVATVGRRLKQSNSNLQIQPGFATAQVS